jgi:hypothetical protein
MGKTEKVTALGWTLAIAIAIALKNKLEMYVLLLLLLSRYYNIRLRNTPFGYLFCFYFCVDGYYNTLIHLRTKDAVRTYENYYYYCYGCTAFCFS